MQKLTKKKLNEMNLLYNDSQEVCIFSTIDWLLIKKMLGVQIGSFWGILLTVDL